MMNKFFWIISTSIFAVIRPRMRRNTNEVDNEYSDGWSVYSPLLEKSRSVEEWLCVEGIDNQQTFHNLSGKLTYGTFDSNNYNRKLILETILKNFPDVKSITEYGCGLGRNLLFLKKHLPNVDMYGYELCTPGVEIAREASKKFGLNVEFNQLDYVNSNDSNFIYPNTDIAFTLYSLEQLPNENRVAIENILRHVKHGSIHIEPVPENYPYSIRGIIGRLNHRKANYLKNFEKNIATVGKIKIIRKKLNTSHNPLMFPTLYIFKKIKN